MFIAVLRVEIAEDVCMSRLLILASWAKTNSPPFFGQVNCWAATSPPASASAATEARSHAKPRFPLGVMTDLLVGEPCRLEPFPSDNASPRHARVQARGILASDCDAGANAYPFLAVLSRARRGRGFRTSAAEHLGRLGDRRLRHGDAGQL